MAQFSKDVLNKIRQLFQGAKQHRRTGLFLGVEHVGIYPTKQASGQAIVEWYRDRFGFEIQEGNTNFWLSGSGSGRIEVMKEAITDRCHMAVQVSDFEQAMAYLKAKGVALDEPLKTKPGIKAVFLKEPDPSGNLVHLFWLG